MQRNMETQFYQCDEKKILKVILMRNIGKIDTLVSQIDDKLSQIIVLRY